jgi:DNA repair exonuclease SbcCD ATPase subunit
MKIIQLTAENFKRLRAITIRPDGAMVQITGRNSQGKTSALDAISAALGGQDQICERPIRDGEQKAKVVCEMEGLVVTRTFSPSGSTLTVTNSEGAKYPSPQAMLDKLVGKLSFDPLSFSRMPVKQQLETLRTMVGIDFTTIDQRRAELYRDRSDVNRDIKNTEGQLAGMKMHPDTPAEEISVAGIMAERKEAEAVVSKNRQFRSSADAARASVEEWQRNTEYAVQAVARVEKELAAAKNSLGQHRERLGEAETRATNFAADAAKLIDPVLEVFDSKIQEADGINRKVRENKGRAKLVTELATLKAESEKFTQAIEAKDSEKAAQMSAAKFPVAGLSFNESGVVFNKVPFSQASSAEQLRVSVAMGLAMNPKLRVLLIRDGSLLDEDNLRMVAEMAEAADAQVWIERVDAGDHVGVVIEDGSVVAKTGEVA